MSEYKYIRVKTDTHRKIKVLAAQEGKTHDELVSEMHAVYLASKVHEKVSAAIEKAHNG